MCEMFFLLCASLPEVHIDLPKILEGRYPEGVDTVLADGLLAASVLYRRDVIGRITKNEEEWIRDKFDMIGCIYSKKIADSHNVGHLYFKIKNGPVGGVFPPPRQYAYDHEWFMPYTLEASLTHVRYLYTDSCGYWHPLIAEGWLRPHPDRIAEGANGYPEYAVPGRHASHQFYSIGCGLGASTAVAATKSYARPSTSFRDIDVISYFCGGDFVLKDREWRNIHMPYYIGECNAWDFEAPEMVDPYPLYSRHPWWVMKALGFRYPKYQKKLIITGHRNGPNALDIPDTYCPYFKTAIKRPWIMPWGFTPPCRPFGQMHKGWRPLFF
jgi:hypothetical protein